MYHRIMVLAVLTIILSGAASLPSMQTSLPGSAPNELARGHCTQDCG